jgi:hypothetical protein
LIVTDLSYVSSDDRLATYIRNIIRQLQSLHLNQAQSLNAKLSAFSSVAGIHDPFLRSSLINTIYNTITSSEL